MLVLRSNSKLKMATLALTSSISFLETLLVKSHSFIFLRNVPLDVRRKIPERLKIYNWFSDIRLVDTFPISYSELLHAKPIDLAKIFLYGYLRSVAFRSNSKSIMDAIVSDLMRHYSLLPQVFQRCCSFSG